MSLSFMMRRSWPSILTSVPDHLPNSTLSPAFTSRGVSLPLSSRPPGPTAMISPSWGFSAFEALDDHAVVQGTEIHG